MLGVFGGGLVFWGSPGTPTLPELICRVSFPTDSPLIRNLNLGHIDLGLRPKPGLPTETPHTGGPVPSSSTASRCEREEFC